MRLLLFLMFYLALSSSSLMAREPVTIYVTERGGKTFYQGKTIQTEEFLTGIKKARDGDRVVILPGTYRGPYMITKQASPNQPITIAGTPELSIFGCGDLPTNEGKSPLKFSVAQGLIIENLKFESCWPSAVNISDSSYLTFRNNHIVGGHNAFRIAEQSTHSIIITGNSWLQDDTKKDLWSSNPASVARNSKLFEFQGAFVAAHGVLGNLIVERNVLSHAYAGLACSMDSRHRFPMTNVLFTNNQVEYLRGPLLEANCALHNVYLVHNTVNQYGTLLNNQSEIDGLMIWGNTLAGNGGKVPNVIFSNKGLIKHLMFAQNTAQGVANVFAEANKGLINGLTFTNNLFQVTGDEVSWKDLKSATSASISHNISNLDIPGQTRTKVADSPFRNATDLDFRLTEKNAAIDSGKILHIGKWHSRYEGNRPDVGAFEGEQLSPAPPHQWAPLAGMELGHPVHVIKDASTVEIMFSKPIKFGSAPALVALSAQGRRHNLKGCKQSSPTSIRCELGQLGSVKWGLDSAWLTEQKIVLWPHTDQLSATKPETERSKLLDF